MVLPRTHADDWPPSDIDAMIRTMLSDQESLHWENLRQMVLAKAHKFCARSSGLYLSAEDIEQEAMIDVSRGLSSFQHIADLRFARPAFLKWVEIVATRCWWRCAQKQRQYQSWHQPLFEDPFDDEGDTDWQPYLNDVQSDVGSMAVNHETLDVVRDGLRKQLALGGKDERDAVRLILAVDAEMDYQAIAQWCGCTENQVRESLRRMRTNLRRYIETGIWPQPGRSSTASNTKKGVH